MNLEKYINERVEKMAPNEFSRSLARIGMLMGVTYVLEELSNMGNCDDINTILKDIYRENSRLTNELDHETKRLR